MFHNGVFEDDNTTIALFGTNMKSLTQVWAMFLGEIDFGGQPIQKNREVLAYLFLLVFMFAIVLVLNNLLNGLAVNDIEKINNDAAILHLQMYVDSIVYSDYILGAYKSVAERIGKIFPGLLPLMNTFDLTKRYTLFSSKEFDFGNHSEAIANREIKLKFKSAPITPVTCEEKECIQSNTIISEAKKILLRRRKRSKAVKKY